MSKSDPRPSTSHIAPFGLRMQPELKERLEQAARDAGRSLNAEIIARLQTSLDDHPPSFVPEIRISLNTGEEPISWDEIHEIISAVRKKLDINAVSLHVSVETPELVSSSKREQETAELAAKLRPQPYSTKGTQTEGSNKLATKRMPARATQKKPE